MTECCRAQICNCMRTRDIFIFIFINIFNQDKSSLACPDPIFAQGHYGFQYKRKPELFQTFLRGALILKATAPLYENRVWPHETRRSLFCSEFHLFFFMANLFLIYCAQDFAQNFNILLLKVKLHGQLLSSYIIHIIYFNCIYTSRQTAYELQLYSCGCQ